MNISLLLSLGERLPFDAGAKHDSRTPSRRVDRVLFAYPIPQFRDLQMLAW